MKEVPQFLKYNLQSLMGIRLLYTALMKSIALMQVFNIILSYP